MRVFFHFSEASAGRKPFRRLTLSYVCARQDLNLEPLEYQSSALPVELRARVLILPKSLLDFHPWRKRPSKVVQIVALRILLILEICGLVLPVSLEKTSVLLKRSCNVKNVKIAFC